MVAAVERWTVMAEDERLARHETTTWLLDEPRLVALLSSNGLRLVERRADLTGAPYAPDADFKTLTIVHA